MFVRSPPSTVSIVETNRAAPLSKTGSNGLSLSRRPLTSMRAPVSPCSRITVAPRFPTSKAWTPSRALVKIL